MHEHVFVLAPEALQNYGHLWGASYWDEEERVADAIAKLRALREHGIQTIVDPTVPGLGRYIPRIQRVNAEVDLNIVVATGVYTFHDLPLFLRPRTDDAIAEIFIREIREGIDDTGVKAAFLKCAVDLHGITGDVPRILSACATASLETGAPIMVHTNAKLQTGLPALAELTRLGVTPASIVIAHAGDSDDLAYLRAIADTGASLGYDRFNMDFYAPDSTRLSTLSSLLARGLRRSRAPRARRVGVLRRRRRQPAVRGRGARLPAHLPEDPARAARRGRDAGPDRSDADRQPAAVPHATSVGRRLTRRSCWR